MPLRMLEIVVPLADSDEALKLLAEHEVTRMWSQGGAEKQAFFKLLLPGEKTEAVLDALENRFPGDGRLRIVVLPVEASLPRPEPEPKDKKNEEASPPDAAENAMRVSREELYADLAEVAALTKVYVIMVILSALVAAMGMLRDQVAVVIGAMVIAPLLGPNMAMALAVTLGDVALGRRAVRTLFVGVGLAFVTALVLGMLLPVDPAGAEIASRTYLGPADFLLALVAGAAGALAFTSGVSASLIGVMVAVALMPPLVSFGLLMGCGAFGPAMGALLLLSTNVICINLAGVVTFMFQGIRPRRWWEAERASKAARWAMAVWLTLLCLLAVLVYIAPHTK